jgi:hypothetical protein
VEAAVMAVDQATVVMTKALTAARHLRTHMVEDHVHQTTWTTKFLSKYDHHFEQTKKGDEISAL